MIERRELGQETREIGLREEEEWGQRLGLWTWDFVTHPKYPMQESRGVL